MLRIAGEIEEIRSRKDNTWRLTIGTQELAKEDEAELVGLKGKLGFFVFAVTETITEKDIPEGEVEFKGDKTPGQRLRAVLYRLWESDNAGYKDFETFYKSRMERLIEQIKEKLQ